MPKVLRKRCSKCKEWKDTKSFNKNRSRTDGLHPHCRDCRKTYHTESYSEQIYFAYLLRTYGLTREAYTAMYQQQNGCCAICEVPEAYQIGKGRLHVDHCHSTGIIRGLLCSGCNTGIGGLDHDPKILAAAIDYLDQTKGVMDGGAVIEAQG